MTLQLLERTKPVKLTRADRLQIDSTLERFVQEAMGRTDLAAAYRLTTPSLRGGLTPAAWRQGSIPVYPYHARPGSTHGWSLQFVEGDRAALEEAQREGTRLRQHRPGTWQHRDRTAPATLRGVAPRSRRHDPAAPAHDPGRRHRPPAPSLDVLPDPGARTPAPDQLRPIQAFVNTLDLENGIEELASPGALADVLERAGLAAPGIRPNEADLRAALEVREALRALLLANNGVAVDGEELAPLERAARAGQLAARFSADGGAGLVAIVLEARADGSLERLKACRRDVCHWVFYDRSRNRGSHWCAMSVCSNRTKTRTYRSRRTA